MSGHVHVRVMASLAIAIAAAPAAAQSDHSTVAGTVRSDGGQHVRWAIVGTADGRARASTDSLGRFLLEGVAPGRLQLRARAIGFVARDTVLVVKAGEQARWDVVLRPFRWAGDGEAARDRSGRIDSVGRGLLKPAVPDAAPFGRFGREFFAQTLRRAPADANTIVSPASAALALSMVFAGAQGETASEMARSLAPDGTDPVRRGAALVAALRDRQDVTLHVANAVWVDNRLELQPRFHQTVAASYGATVRAVPLATQHAVDEINRWVSAATRGKIRGILDEPLGGDAGLFIANAVYFKGKWIDQFDKTHTRERDFTLPSGRRVVVPAMERVGRYGYRRAAGYQVLRLPYRGGRTALYIVLPDSGTTVAALVDRLGAAAAWPETHGPADVRGVRVVLPRFKVERSMELDETLQAMGMRRAFDPARADFGALARPRSGGGAANLFVAAALQKVFVEVNEEGTEAAAVTGIAMVTSAPPPPIPFVVDRSFLFLLRDEVTGADLFIGRVSDPR
jgi:serpin B